MATEMQTSGAKQRRSPRGLGAKRAFGGAKRAFGRLENDEEDPSSDAPPAAGGVATEEPTPARVPPWIARLVVACASASAGLLLAAS